MMTGLVLFVLTRAFEYWQSAGLSHVCLDVHSTGNAGSIVLGSCLTVACLQPQG